MRFQFVKDQRSQSLKIPTSTSTSTKKKSVPDQRSHTMKACYTNQKRLPKPKPKPKPSPPAEEWEKYLDEVERDEEQFAMKTSETFAESAAMDSFTADFSHGSGFTNCAISPRHKYLSNCGKLPRGCLLFPGSRS